MQDPSASPNEKAFHKTDLLYWLFPALIIVISTFGAFYALTTPAVTVQFSNPEAQKLVPALTEKMWQCSRWGIAISFLWSIVGTTIMMTFLQLGFASRLRDFCERKTPFMFLQVTLFTLVFSGAIQLLTLPLSYFTDFVFEHHFGLSSQPIADWLRDLIKGFLVGVVLEIPLWALLLFLVRKFPRKWPYLQAALTVPITVFMTFISPVVFEPIFNKIELMQPSPFRDEIRTLATKAGLQDAPIFVSDKSKQTNTMNAYVSGIGPTARIVIWDTTLKSMKPEQVLCVVAHEFGHYALHHTLIYFGIGLLFTLWSIPINLFLTPLFFKYIPEKWGVRNVQDLAAITMFMYVSHCAGFFMEPAQNFYHRMIERDADFYGLKIHHDPLNFARAFAFLSEKDLADPFPPKLFELWLCSHPPLGKRIEYMTEEFTKSSTIHTEIKIP